MRRDVAPQRVALVPEPCIMTASSMETAMKLALIAAVLNASTVPAFAACLPDPSNVTIRGKVVAVHSHDKHNGSAYTYYILRTATPYCMAGDDEDASDTTPTRKITIVSNTGDDSGVARYAGRVETVTGKIQGSNGGGPQIFYTTISP